MTTDETALLKAQVVALKEIASLKAKLARMKRDK
jgi:hypothetical protein